jgi:hypothetical protein
MEKRRDFLTGLVVTGAIGSAWLLVRQGAGAQFPQAPQPPPPPRAPQDKNGPPDASPDNPNLPSVEKRMLEENEKDIKKKVEKLYELATQLKAEVDKTDSSKVLSVAMLKKTEEIEKLARDIRNRSKG